jgi:tRNA threonylcarbamoyladenosine biosynthesis protein TsaE
MELRVSNISELPDAASEILTFSEEHRVFLFYGEMGAGKTTLIKALCEHLQVEDGVSSPTFSIVNEYVGPGLTVYHFDFYRIKNQSEAFDLGYEDYLYSGNYCFIEWPEKIADLLPEKFVELKLHETSKDERVIKVHKVN